MLACTRDKHNEDKEQMKVEYEKDTAYILTASLRL